MKEAILNCYSEWYWVRKVINTFFDRKKNLYRFDAVNIIIIKNKLLQLETKT